MQKTLFGVTIIIFPSKLLLLLKLVTLERVTVSVSLLVSGTGASMHDNLAIANRLLANCLCLKMHACMCPTEALQTWCMLFIISSCVYTRVYTEGPPHFMSNDNVLCRHCYMIVLCKLEWSLANCTAYKWHGGSVQDIMYFYSLTSCNQQFARADKYVNSHWDS